MNPQNQTALDPQVVNLAKAIREIETGGQPDPFVAKGKSGEFGAYQYTPDTWKKDSIQFLGKEIPLASADKLTQNEVAYKKLKHLKDQGYNVGQIASIWNSGSPDWQGKVGTNKYGVRYNVPQYVDAVANAYQSLKSGGTPTYQKTASTVTDPNVAEGGYKPWFPATGNEGGVAAGFKAAGNLIPSAFNFGKGLIRMINPVNTLKTIGEIPQAYREAKEALGDSDAMAISGAAAHLLPETVKAFTPESIQQIVKGDLQGAAKTFQEDPFGQAAPVVLAAGGAAKAGGPRATRVFEKAVEKTAAPVIKPVEAAGRFAGDVTTSAVSHLTGLEPSTIRKIIADPKQFSKIQQENATRGGLAGEVRSAIETRLEDLSDVGKGYQSIRSSNQVAQVPPGWIDEVLLNKGLKIGKNGKITADSNSITRNPADLRALEKFYKDWSKKKQLSPNEYLNMRSDLGELSKFDKLTGSGKTRASETVGKDLYAKANELIRDKSFEELSALDEVYRVEREFLDGVQKDYFNRDGTFKDGAPGKIANALNKEGLRERLEALIPGISKRIEILKAVEDIQKASGIKVGTYGRILAGAGGYATGGLPGLIVSEIITSPSMAVPILRSYGYLGEKAAPIVNTLRVLGGDVGKKGGIMLPLMNQDR